MIAADTRAQVMSDLRGEERLVTVVFADMTESVRRTSQLSAEEATVLVNPLLETMVELMVRYGGRIDRFLGDGVLAVFGVPTSHEDDPFRAVRAALELRERAVDLGLAVTCGVNTGRVYFGPVGSDLHEELTVMGPTVNLAARFQGAASAGETVVGSSTAAHIAASFDLSPVTLTIKGIAQPVEAFKAERLLDHPDKVRGIEGLRADMVGRDDELEQLRSGVGTSGTFALIGPAGVGKSRLAAEFRSSVEASGGRWMEGRCLELTETTSYAPFIDLFRRQLPALNADGLARSLDSLVTDGGLTRERADQVSPFLAHLLGFGDDRDLRVTESDAETRKALTIDAIVEYLAAWSRLGPLAVFLEDVHWADPLSRDTLRRLHETPGPERVLVVAYRPDDRITDLLGESACQLVLDELSRDETHRLVAMLLETSGIPRWLESQILDRAQGNPFYVEELIRSLIQKGAIARKDGRWSVATDHVELDLPESVEGVLMSRFDRLGAATRRAAKAASVLNRTFDTSTFAALSGDGLVPELETLTGAGILLAERNHSTRYSFVHALTRQAIYTNLLPSQRAELHEQAARALEHTAVPDVEQIAGHYAASRNDAKAVEYLLAAGERALASFTNDTAEQFLDDGLQRIEALAEPERAMWRGRYQARRGELLERSARHGEARLALDEALASGAHGPLDRARILRLIGQTHRLESDTEAAIAALDRAEEVLADFPADDREAAREWIRLQKERAMALYFGGRGRELPAHNQRVAPVVERHGSAAQQADHLYGQVLSSFIDDHYLVPEATVAMARRALELAEGGADPGRVAEGRFVLGFSLLWGDMLEPAVETLEKAVTETARVGAVTEEVRARAYLAIALRRLGRVDEAASAATAALEAARNIQSPYYVGHALAVLCWAEWKRGGDCEPLGAEAYAAWGKSERDGHRGLSTEFAWLAVWPRVAAALHRDDLEGAVDHLRILVTPWERPMPDDVRTAVDAALLRGDHAAFAHAVEAAEIHGYL